MTKLVPPRVAAAVWGLVWNRWCTSRRFQQKSPCVLGCSDSEDSIEHYLGCKIAKEAGRRMLKIDEGFARRKQLMLATTRFKNDDEQTCWAILTYGIYMVTNEHRGQQGKTAEPEELIQEIMQHVRQAVMGHRAAARTLRTRWVR